MGEAKEEREDTMESMITETPITEEREAREETTTITMERMFTTEQREARDHPTTRIATATQYANATAARTATRYAARMDLIVTLSVRARSTDNLIRMERKYFETESLSLLRRNAQKA